MKTLEQALEIHKKTKNYEHGLPSAISLTLWGFIPNDMRKDFNLNPVEEYKLIPFTRENILLYLQKSVAYGFTKALDCRGISSSSAFDSVRGLNIILEEGLENLDGDNSYQYYGLPLFKATAIKYGFPDEIEGFRGDESRFEGS